MSELLSTLMAVWASIYQTSAIFSNLQSTLDSKSSIELNSMNSRPDFNRWIGSSHIEFYSQLQSFSHAYFRIPHHYSAF